MAPKTDATTALPYTFPSKLDLSFYEGTINPATGELYQDPVVGGPYKIPAGALPNPSRPLSQGIRSSFVSVAFDSGHEQRRVKSPPKRTWDCQYNYLKPLEYNTLRNFYMKVQTCNSFYWTDPLDKQRYTVRFDMEILQGICKYHGPAGPGYEASIKLVQVF